LKIKVKDIGRFRDETTESMVETFANTSILEVIASPDEGRKYFKARTDKFRDEIHDEWRALDDLVNPGKDQIEKAKEENGSNHG